MRVDLVSRLLRADHPRARLGACREVMESGLTGLASCGSAHEGEIMSYPPPLYLGTAASRPRRADGLSVDELKRVLD